ncbi:MAG: YHS domain-containing protein [Candidatus Bathyarchaeales archaeon]
MTKDPVCGMAVDEKTVTYKTVYDNNVYYFCSIACQLEFLKHPEKYQKTIATTRHAAHYGGYCGSTSCGPPARGIAWYLYFGLLILLVLLLLFLR